MSETSKNLPDSLLATYSDSSSEYDGRDTKNAKTSPYSPAKAPVWRFQRRA